MLKSKYMKNCEFEKWRAQSSTHYEVSIYIGQLR
jgi:hypothetical protein